MKRIIAVCIVSTCLVIASCGGGNQIKSDSDSSFAYHYNLGMAAFDKGDYREAIKHFQRSLKLNPNIARTNNELGMCYLFLNDHKAAVPYFERAIELDPRFGEAHNNLGVALFSLGQYRDAEMQFQATLSSPDYGTTFIPLYNLGNIYQIEERNDLAISTYMRALEEEAKITVEYRINLHFQLGKTLMKVERYADAYPHFEDVLVLNPRLVEAAFDAGVCAYVTSKFDDARTMFSRVITVAPGTEWEQRALAYMEKMDR